jgi:hypothetical protein
MRSDDENSGRRIERAFDQSPADHAGGRNANDPNGVLALRAVRESSSRPYRNVCQAYTDSARNVTMIANQWL